MCTKNSVACINLTFGSLKEIYLYCGSKAEVWTLNGFYPILYIVKVAKYQNQFSFLSHPRVGNYCSLMDSLIEQPYWTTLFHTVTYSTYESVSTNAGFT